MSELYKQMRQAVIDYDEDLAVALAQKALDQGMVPLDAIENGFAAGMAEVGKKFDELEIFLPEVMAAA
ncbi:MAG: B12-binding domain-containing protein, partial [Clostridiales bacterium]